MKHALSIGGTGMLARATEWFGAEGYHVTVIARAPDALCEGNAALHPVSCDWNNEEGFFDAVSVAPAPELVLMWQHGPWRRLPLEVAKVLSARQAFDLYLVLGSAVSDPAREDEVAKIEETFAEVSGCRLHLILLGFVSEGATSRWLTNEEISTGAIEAMTSQSRRTVIGTTRPWSARP